MGWKNLLQIRCRKSRSAETSKPPRRIKRRQVLKHGSQARAVTGRGKFGPETAESLAFMRTWKTSVARE